MSRTARFRIFKQIPDCPSYLIVVIVFFNVCGEDGGDDNCESGGDDGGSGSECDLFCFENMPTR